VSLGLVMTAAMTLNLVLSAIAGGSDPAHHDTARARSGARSSFLITAITDSGGFFIFLGLRLLFLV